MCRIIGLITFGRCLIINVIVNNRREWARCSKDVWRTLEKLARFADVFNASLARDHDLQRRLFGGALSAPTRVSRSKFDALLPTFRRELKLIVNISCVRALPMFQVKINPGAPIQIVQNGLTIRHPVLPPVPESPPQPLPPLNLDVLSTVYPALETQFFGNSAQQQLPAAAGPTSFYADGTYHNLFKREKDGSKRRTLKDETVVSSLTKSERPIAKRDTEKTSRADSSDGKVRTIETESINSIHSRLISERIAIKRREKNLK